MLMAMSIWYVFLKKMNIVNSLNSIEKVMTITIGDFEFPLPVPEKKYQTLIVGTMHIPVEVIQCYTKVLQFYCTWK